ncbi:PSP domain-containing protein [Aphelenchoides besseyi]|nr:PSP domain-containing protein [Aphelenchoides besseyi]KAI6236728.1 PSP domain-containing protein [Aphelenchoides besseyi]
MSSPETGYDSDELKKDLTEKEKQEIERRRRKNKKKKESKKNRRKAEEPVIQTIEDPGRSTAEEGDVQSVDVSEKIADSDVAENGDDSAKKSQVKFEIEYVPEEPMVNENDPKFKEFSRVFDAFKIKTEEDILREEEDYQYRRDGNLDTFRKAEISERILQEEMEERRKENDEGGNGEIMSRRKLRISMQPSIASLKANTARPDVVEWADVTSRDPHLLVHLKSYRNTVPIPRHWNAKRKYLAGKRGFERPPFELPEFIKRTGIMEMRETMWEKEGSQTLKSQMRERMRPKLGRIDIDYQKLHDAFFKWQTKPFLTKMGELYYEGKELEAQMKEKKPGMLSDELRIALGMPVGPNSQKFPPPWLIAMQRYGPPPSYPNLKIPGLNCPIPEGCSFGYHAGGWGKPPVDEYGKPLYGDVFGLELPNIVEPEDETQIDRRHWGEVGSDEEEESDNDSDMDEDDEGSEMPPPVVHGDSSGYATPAPTDAGTITPSGITTIPGVETPDTIELRKRRTVEESSVAGGDTPAGQLYTIVPEKRVDRLNNRDIMASTHVYDLSKKSHSDSVEVSLDPENLDLTNQSALNRVYDEQLRKETRSRAVEPEEDFSDMIAENAAKQNRKRRAPEQKKTNSSSSSQKKHKNFKF